MKIYIAIIASILCAMGLATPWDQYVATAFTAGASGTNVSFVGEFTANTSSGTNSLSQAYTCNSTTNRLIIVGEVQSSAATSVTLSDTGGLAGSANVILSFTQLAGAGYETWNMGCSASSNTITITQGGATVPNLVLKITEYSGIGNSGSGSIVNVSSGQTFSSSGTASSNGMLTFVTLGISTNQTFFTATTAGFNYRNSAHASGGIVNGNTSYPTFDNLNTSSGTVNFTTTAGASTTSGSTVMMLFIPGLTAASPGWYPTMIQSNTGCGGTVLAMHQNVTSGNPIGVAFGSEATGNPPSSITDTLSTTYTLRVTQNIGTSNQIWLYTGVPSSSGADTITANGSGFSFECLGAAEFNSPVGTFTDSASDNTSSTLMSWTQTISTANSIVFAACKSFHSSTRFSFTGVSFTQASQGGGQDSQGESWARTTSTSSVTPIFGIDTGDSNVCASIVMH